MKNVLVQRVRNMEDAVVTLPASRNLTVIASNLSRTFFCYLDFGSFMIRIFKICKILRRLVQRVTLTRLLQKSEQLNLRVISWSTPQKKKKKNDKIAERMVEANSFFRWGAANRVRA